VSRSHLQNSSQDHLQNYYIERPVDRWASKTWPAYKLWIASSAHFIRSFFSSICLWSGYLYQTRESLYALIASPTLTARRSK
jgi:hypothetical protein